VSEVLPISHRVVHSCLSGRAQAHQNVVEPHYFRHPCTLLACKLASTSGDQRFAERMEPYHRAVVAPTCCCGKVGSPLGKADPGSVGWPPTVGFGAGLSLEAPNRSDTGTGLLQRHSGYQWFIFNNRGTAGRQGRSARVGRWPVGRVRVAGRRANVSLEAPDRLGVCSPVPQRSAAPRFRHRFHHRVGSGPGAAGSVTASPPCPSAVRRLPDLFPETLS
jgi:hypothetical protein